MESRLLDFDPVSKVKRILHMDDELYHAEAVQPVKDLLEVNKAQRNDPASGWGEGRRVASIPLVIWEDLVRKGIAADSKALKAWLNDSDNEAFRTRKGKI